MGKRHQVGCVVYIADRLDWDENIEHYKRKVIKGTNLTARINRIGNLSEEKWIGHPPSPLNDDPLDRVGTLAIKGWGEKLPWYKGWIDSLKARWELWRQGVCVG